MRASPNLLFLAMAIVLPVAPVCSAAQTSDGAGAVALAQKQVGEYLQRLGDLDCTEIVTQEKLGENGHVMASERDTFDYLIMMSGDANDFQLNESRLEKQAPRKKLPATPMLVSNGIATVLLVFHSYYRDAFTFTIGTAEMVNGEQAIPIHFAHIQGRRSPAVLALRGREFPLGLAGTAWLDEATKQIVKIDAGLERDMSDIGLRSLKIEVEYKSETVSGRKSQINLPAVAVVDVTTPRQHWRNTHVFDNYRSFSTGAQQGTDVKVVSTQPGAADNQAPHSAVQPPTKKP